MAVLKIFLELQITRQSSANKMTGSRLTVENAIRVSKFLKRYYSTEYLEHIAFSSPLVSHGLFRIL